MSPPAAELDPARPITAVDDPARAKLWQKMLSALAHLPETQDSYAPLRLQALFEEGLTDEVGTGVRDKVIQQLQAEEDGLNQEISAYESALGAISDMLAQPPRASPPMTPVIDLPTADLHTSVSDQKAFESTANEHAPQGAVAASLDGSAVEGPSSANGPAAAPPTASYVPIPSFHLLPLAKRHNRERKAELAGQLPLAIGRRVAFRVKSKDEWILAIVRRNNANDVNRYEVVDPETEGGAEKTYHTNSIKNVIPLPTLGAPVDSAAHPSRFAPHAVGSLALALYPGTTTFYRGKVVGRELERPVETPASAKGKKRARSRSIPVDEQRYLVAFEDDDNRLQTVEIGDIAEWPGGQADMV